jgi:hypothetical protein
MCSDNLSLAFCVLLLLQKQRLQQRHRHSHLIDKDMPQEASTTYKLNVSFFPQKEEFLTNSYPWEGGTLLLYSDETVLPLSILLSL